MSRLSEALNLPSGGSESLLHVTELFFDRAAVIRAVDEADRKVLARFGAQMRLRIRSKIRKPRRKTLAELTDVEKHRIKRDKERGGKGQRPFAPSRPGEPPRNVTGLLRDHVYYSWDPATRSVVVGPARLSRGSDVPHILEEGGVSEGRRIEARPYMQPSLQELLPKLPEQYHDLVGARTDGTFY